MKAVLSIGAVATLLGVCINTLRLWEKRGSLLPRFRTAGGHRRYDADDLKKFQRVESDPPCPRRTVAYARVSTHDQKHDLETQTERLRRECHARGWQDADIVTDLGSGMNYTKRGLRKLIGMIYRGDVGRLVLIREDRLLRFGAPLVFEVCRLAGCEVVVIEPRETDPRKTLAEDVLTILTVFDARCSGLKSHSNKRALAANT